MHKPSNPSTTTNPPATQNPPATDYHYRAGFSYSHGWSVFENMALEPVASGYPNLEDAQAEAQRLNVGIGYRTTN